MCANCTNTYTIPPVLIFIVVEIIFYASLKSGRDVRGIASDIFGSEITLTQKTVNDIICAFVCWLTDKTEKPAEEMTISVGHDSRISADKISSDVIDSMMTLGVKVINCTLASTPAMFLTTVMEGRDAAVWITASHHPAHRNGMKFFFLPVDLTTI